MSAEIVYNRILVIFMVQKTFGVALDGPSGSGKSTLARLVAQRYGFVYVDTGSLYRAVGYYIAQKGIDPRDNAAVCAALPGIKLDMRLENGGSAVYLDGVRWVRKYARRKFPHMQAQFRQYRRCANSCFQSSAGSRKGGMSSWTAGI